MSKKKKSAVLIESDSDDSDSGKDLEEVTYFIRAPDVYSVVLCDSIHLCGMRIHSLVQTT